MVSKEKRKCYTCGSDTTYTDHCRDQIKPHEHWYGNPMTDLWLCEKCNNKYIKNPKWKPITNRRRIWDGKGRQIYLPQDPRTGICTRCGAVRDKINPSTGKICTKTVMRPIGQNKQQQYWIELCWSCFKKSS
jgi:hypothetical protein